MADWLLDTGLYLLGIALIPGVGLLLVCWGLWGDRSRGRPRCPKCWYDMRGSLPKVECPECGHDAKQERGLYRNRRRRWPIVLGVVLLLLSSYPLVIVWGRYLEQPAIRQLTKRGHTVSSSPEGLPRWLVDRLPEQLARTFDRARTVTFTAPVTDADMAECGRLRHVGWLEAAKGAVVTDAGLVHLEGLSGLSALELSGARVTDAGLAHLEGLSELGALDLSGTQVTDAGIVHLKGLSELKVLGLSGTQVTDPGLVHLKGLSQLWDLDLSETQVTDTGLVHLRGLSGLKVLDLSGTQVTDAGLAHLEGLSELQNLYLSGAQVTDSGLVHVEGLSGLRVLDLSGTQVTDAGLVHLEGLSGLRVLVLRGTQVTDAGIGDLQWALPYTHVICD